MWAGAGFYSLKISRLVWTRFELFRLCVNVQLTFFRGLPVHSIACGDFHMLGLAMDWTVYAWGYGAEGQCGLGTTLHLRYLLSAGYMIRDILATLCLLRACSSLDSVCTLKPGSHVFPVYIGVGLNHTLVYMSVVWYTGLRGPWRRCVGWACVPSAAAPGGPWPSPSTGTQPGHSFIPFLIIFS